VERNVARLGLRKVVFHVKLELAYTQLLTEKSSNHLVDSTLSESRKEEFEALANERREVASEIALKRAKFKLNF